MSVRTFSVVLLINNSQRDNPLPDYLVEALSRYEKEIGCCNCVIAHDMYVGGEEKCLVPQTEQRGGQDAVLQAVVAKDVHFGRHGVSVASRSLNCGGRGSDIQTAVLDMLSKISPRKPY